MRKRALARMGFWLIVALAPALTGCLVVAAGAAAGGAAAAGYVYYHGLLYRDYPAGLQDSAAATRTALSELHFPLVEERPGTGAVTITTKTGDGTTVRIYLEVVDSRIPVEGPMTRIGVRVGFSGDETVSARILDQISAHLAPVGTQVAPQAPSGQAAPGPVAPVSARLAPPVVPAPAAPRETKAPPLAPSAP